MPRSPVMNRIERRSFLKSVALAGGAAFAASAFQGLGLRAARATAGDAPLRAAENAGGYGDLRPKKPVSVGPGADPDLEWLALPRGFDYAVFGVAFTTMSDGNPTPNAHDGMAAFPARNGRVRLVRNHENRDTSGTPIAGPKNAYNLNGAGGTTTLEIAFAERIPVLMKDFVSLNGTIVNCAGGSTPWGSWISCEETVETRDSVPHGYSFEVPAAAEAPVVPIPFKEMGRFAHEALVIDPGSGIVYETEDNGPSGFYRFIPRRRGDLALGGRLQMLKIKGASNYETKTGQTVGMSLPVEWVPIHDPDPASGGESDVFDQGWAKGGAAFSRLEGCWWSEDSVFFTDTNGGEAGQGQVWQYTPAGPNGGTLKLVYESPSGDVLAFPDNITVSPRGGLLLCEDSSNDHQFLRGLTTGGAIFDLAVDLLDDKEWAGACFSPDGRYLFVNTQGETRTVENPVAGRTYAIWGPWESGAL
ncbi:MAG TPA: alkaline phosphatase PhoX [Actinomycetota bacterium]|nr:alkaline phosphatase PhoX [Actinomycetota bacterium]